MQRGKKVGPLREGRIPSRIFCTEEQPGFGRVREMNADSAVAGKLLCRNSGTRFLVDGLPTYPDSSVRKSDLAVPKGHPAAPRPKPRNRNIEQPPRGHSRLAYRLKVEKIR